MYIMFLFRHFSSSSRCFFLFSFTFTLAAFLNRPVIYAHDIHLDLFHLFIYPFRMFSRGKVGRVGGYITIVAIL